MQDKIIKFLAYNKKVSIVCAKTTNLVEETRKIHDLSPVATAAFGRLITISAIMASNMKNKEDKLTIQIKGNGPIQTMLVTANNIPELKGYVANPYVDIPLNEFGKLDVGGAVGNEGYINVIKDIGLKDPYVGISPLTSGEIADDFTNYFAKSEQTNSAVALGVLVNKDGVKASGGYMITPMPDATDEEIFKIEQSIFKAGAISKMLDEKLTLEEIAKKAEAMREALIQDLKVKRFARGGSTITMQLVKNVFLNRNKNIARKLEEALIVWLIETERLTSKERMYEVYLNIVEWGPLVYGVQEAATYYFKKRPSQLTAEESIFLASIIPKPKHFRNSFNNDMQLKESLEGYYRLITERLVKKGIISEVAADSIRPEINVTGEAKKNLQRDSIQ